jgi:hypothetical protein
MKRISTSIVCVVLLVGSLFTYVRAAEVKSFSLNPVAQDSLLSQEDFSHAQAVTRKGHVIAAPVIRVPIQGGKFDGGRPCSLGGGGSDRKDTKIHFIVKFSRNAPIFV